MRFIFSSKRSSLILSIIGLMFLSSPVWGEAPVIGFTSKQMATNGTQNLTVSGGCGGPYTWTIGSGGGTLSGMTGASVTYTAPSSNPNCSNNPTITVMDSCGFVANLSLAVNGLLGHGAGYYASTTFYEVGELVQNCAMRSLGMCGYQILRHSLLCNGNLTGSYYACSSGGYYGQCTIEEYYAWGEEQCQVERDKCNANCPAGCEPGFHDTRTSAELEGGCCPAALLPPEPPPAPPCNLEITSFTGSSATIDPISGGSIKFSGAISETSGKPVKWTIEVLGETHQGNDSVKWTWDGKGADHRVVTEGSYTATLTAETIDGQCKETMSTPFTVKSNPEDCKLFAEFGSFVNIASGSLSNSQMLFNIPNSKLLGEFTLSYNSLDGNRIPLGTGWTHTYSINLASNNDGSYTVREGNGSRVTLYKNGDSYIPETSSYPILVKIDDGTNLLSHKNGLRYTFSAEGKITRIEDRNANAVAFSHDGNGNLTVINDPSGRTITFNYDGANRIIAIVDPSGNTHSFTYTGDHLATISTQTALSPVINWNYTYDAQGFLLTKTDPQGYTTAYEYDDNHRVIGSTDPEGKPRTISYDPENSLTQVTEKDGGVWAYKYDPNLGALVEKTDPQGGKTTYQYDPKRNLISETDPRGNAASYTYDERDNPTSVTDGLGNVTAYTYNGFNQVATITDPQNNISRMAYDEKGNLISLTDPAGATTQYSYDSRGNVTRVTNANGKATLLGYDQSSNLISLTDPSGAVSKFVYDQSGNLIRQEDSLGNITRFEYDGFNRLTKIIDPLGNVTRYAYDSNGKRTSVTDANGNATYFEYNYRGQATRVTDALRNVTNFTYGGTGCPSCGGGIDKLTSLTDANGNATTFQYDPLGRLIRETDPLGNRTVYSYDARGNLIARTDAKGDTISYSYDPLNRLTQKSYPDGTREVFQYDAKGNIIYAGNKDIAYNFTYDARGKIIQVVDSNGRTVGYQYDALGNRTRMATPEGKTVTYSYDPSSRLAEIESEAGSFNFSHDPLGRRTKLSFPNKTFAAYSYDPASRLTGLVHQTSKGSVINSFHYTHDGVGNRVTRTEGDEKYAYSYDGIYQLLEALPVDRRGKVKEHSPHGEGYSYDAVGNRLTGPRLKDSYLYDQGNQLTVDRRFSYEYDPNGNLVKKRDLDEGKSSVYSYDYENRLTKVEVQKGDKLKTVTFAYDPFGRRISKSVAWEEIEDGDQEGDEDEPEGHGKTRTTIYVYDHENIILEYNQTGKVKARYTHGLGIDEPLVVEKGRQFYYYQADGLGSIIGLTNERGRLVQRYDYDSFGNMSHHGDLIKQPYTYTGREYDPETGLYFYRARYYDPRLGRFLTKDPIGFAGGDGNLYGYVANNPVNWADPLGLWTWAGRLNFTFITADVTVALVIDGEGNIGLQFTPAMGLSLSVGVTGGFTVTNAPCIKDLEGMGTSVGVAVNIPGVIPGFGAEANHIWSGWPTQYKDSPYKGVDVGAGVGLGFPVTPQVFTGPTVTLFQGRYK